MGALALRRSGPLALGAALLAAYVGYACSGLRQAGPQDKLLQLALLGPAIGLLAWAVGRQLRPDLGEKVLALLDRPRKVWFLLGAAMLLFAFAAWMAYGPLKGIPKGGDETAYFFQSKVYAAGKLTAPAPPVPEPERFYPFRLFIFRHGMWLTMYTPTHAALLAPFTRLGLAPLFGVVEGVLSLLGAFLLIRLWAGERLARASVLILLLSPFFLLMVPTLMAHNSCLLLITWSLYFLSLAWLKDRFWLSVIAGFVFGLALTTKPYPDIAWAAFVFLALVLQRRKGIKLLCGLAAGGALPIAALLCMNWLYTGSPLKMTYDLARGGRLIGFGAGKAFFPEYGDFNHTIWRGIKNVLLQAEAGSTSLLGWPLLSLLPLAVGLLAARTERRLLWLYGQLVLMALLMTAHYTASVDYGPRHYFSFVAAAAFLSAVGLRWLWQAARRRWGTAGSNFAVLALGGLFAITLLLYLPEEIALRRGPWQAIDEVPGRLAERLIHEPAVIFMQADERGYPHLMSGVNFTSPFLDGPYIFCVHQTPAEDQEFMAAFPARKPYLFWYDGSSSHLEPWREDLAAKLVPARDLHPDPARVRTAPGTPPGK